ncbi:hypothetical protein ACV3ZD_03610 [Clostridium perfringens]|uniref:hypothetical protein n=1 Tax=Clostridium perfringens TaxID=1502 RepID=UPI003A0FD2E0
MNSVSLVLYIIRVYDFKTKKYMKVEGENFSLLKTLEGYFNDRKSIACDSDSNKAINTKKIKIDIESGDIYGLLETGNYGFSSSIKKIKTGELTHSKMSDEADMIPLFFNAVIKKDAYKAIISLEKFKTYGCKTILETDINQYLLQKGLTLKIKLHPMLPLDVAKKYLEEGNVCRMRLIKNTLPKDIGDIYKDEVKLGNFGTFEYVLNPKKNKFLPFKNDIKKYLNNAIGMKNIIEVEGIDYDNIKAEIDINGKKKTINLNNIEKLTGDIDISEDIVFSNDGHPEYKSILKVSKEILDEYIALIDFENYEINESEVGSKIKSSEGELNGTVAN